MGLNRPGGRIVVRWTPSPKLKGKKIAVLRAHHVRIDLGLGFRTPPRALIGGAQPNYGWGALVTLRYIKMVGAGDSGNEVRCTHTSPPTNPNPIN